MFVFCHCCSFDFWMCFAFSNLSGSDITDGQQTIQSNIYIYDLYRRLLHGKSTAAQRCVNINLKIHCDQQQFNLPIGPPNRATKAFGSALPLYLRSTFASIPYSQPAPDCLFDATIDEHTLPWRKHQSAFTLCKYLFVIIVLHYTEQHYVEASDESRAQSSDQDGEQNVNGIIYDI